MDKGNRILTAQQTAPYKQWYMQYIHLRISFLMVEGFIKTSAKIQKNGSLAKPCVEKLV